MSKKNSLVEAALSNDLKGFRKIAHSKMSQVLAAEKAKIEASVKKDFWKNAAR